MSIRISFSDVSKRYRLGLTRTSVPALLKQSIFQLMSLKQASLKDNTFWALKNVTFDLHEGESLALIGANGAGKSTILKLLANITRPTSGKIESHGRISALIELGAGFHPDLTGRENIFLNGTILGLKRDELLRRFDEIVDFSGVEEFIDTPLKRYSSGMMVRLGFAVASCISPDILLVDEILAVGDVSFQQKCLEKINGLISNYGTSLIFVSHNFYLVKAVCKKALYLEKGIVKMAGETDEAITAYESALDVTRTQKFKFNDDIAAYDGDRGLEITEVEVTDSEGFSFSSISNSSPLRVQINYYAEQDLGKVNASVFIIRSDGMYCCMSRTKIDNFEINISKGKGVLCLNMEPLHLITGSYFAEAWFLNEDDSAILSSGGRSKWFSISGSRFSSISDSGVFEPQVRWENQFIRDAPLENR